MASYRDGFLFEVVGTLRPDAMDERWKPGGGTRRKDAATGGIERGGIEPIRRPPASSDDEPLVHPQIPTHPRGKRHETTHVDCGFGNRAFRTRDQAYVAAVNEAQRLSREKGGTYVVGNPDGRHRPGQLPHFHIRTPDGKRCRGHFFYGRLPYPTNSFWPKARRSPANRGQRSIKRPFQRESEHLFEVLSSAEADRMAKQRDASMTAQQRAVILQAIEAKMAKEEHKKGARKSTRDDHQQALARKKAAKMARAMRIFRTQGFEAALADAKR